jgi:hypothetical protein
MVVADDADTVVVVVVADDTWIISSIAASNTARHIPRSGEIHLRNHDLLLD